ncbi:MAG: hypothetical protein QF704_15355, partial [Anaerolineales bacterium]|nr:hypothetical protein [Anaerolineales bacterium]
MNIGVLVLSLGLFSWQDDGSNRLVQLPLELTQPRTLQASFKTVSANISGKPKTRGNCPTIPVSLTDSDFDDGPYTLQAGFAEGESLGATYEVPPDAFPIRVDVMEVLFGTSNTTEQTTTHWSVTVWDGTPTQGIQIASFSSDDIILPHLVMPPGTNGVIISVSVNPDDPEQIYIYNDSGMNSFTVAFRIDQHNQAGNPCISSPPVSKNAFPCTDMSGLDFPSENWIDAV